MRKVFIGSTSRDLKDYREAAISACLELGFHPIAMEYFEAMEVGATEGSKRKVDEADLYVGVFAFRYGYIENGYDKSVTEIEFDYAGQRGLDRLCFMADAQSKWSPADMDMENSAKLQAFKNRIDSTLIRAQFRDPNDFKSRLVSALVKWRDRNPEPTTVLSAVLAQSRSDILYLPRFFVKRDDLLNEANRLLDQKRNVLLHGLGGAGKTTLAAAISAGRLQATSAPILWLQTGQAEAEDICDALARPFGREKNSDIIQASGDPKFLALRRLLDAEQVGLVVLDDVWKWEAVSEILQKGLPADQLVLATSRQAVAANFARLAVGRLERAAALELLDYNAQRTVEPREQAEKLCEQLGDHAFMLQIAGKVMQLDGVLLSQLIDDTDLPALEDPDSPPEDRRSFKALMDTSLAKLDDGALAVLRAFGALATPTASSDLLASYLQHRGLTMDIDAALVQLHRRLLVEKLVTERGVPVYEVHQLVHSYMRSLFIADGADYAPLSQALSDYMDTYRTDIDALDVEANNILGMADIASRSDMDDTFTTLLYKLIVEASYFDYKGYTPDPEQMGASNYNQNVLDLLKAGVAAAEKTHNARAAHYLNAKLGNYYVRYAGELEKAQQYLTQALHWAEAMPDPHRQAIMLIWLGGLRFRLEMGDSDDYYERALSIAREHEDKHAITYAMYSRGMEAYTREEDDKALRFFMAGTQVSKSLLQAQETVSPHLETIYFHCLLNTGASQHNLGDVDTAIQTHQATLAYAVQKNNRMWQGHAQFALGEDYNELSDTQRAIEHFKQALTSFQQVGAEMWVNRIENLLAQIANQHKEDKQDEDDG